MRNIARIRDMDNASLEEIERERGSKSIRVILEQLIEALGVVRARAEEEKAGVDSARVDAEV